MTDSFSGDLQRLAAWWHRHRPPGPRKVAWLIDPIDPAAATTEVNRAVDSGATVIALLGRGDEQVARAAISIGAKVGPVAVRDQPSGMSDLTWMSEVAAIRDLRGADDIGARDPAITAAAAALRAASDRGTPVVFDGLIAHAGAMSTGEFEHAWLPASSSTDPAICVAHERWNVRPALDLHLRAENDWGLRAVFALLDLLDQHDVIEGD